MDLSSLEGIYEAIISVVEYISSFMSDVDYSKVIDTLSSIITWVSSFVQ